MGSDTLEENAERNRTWWSGEERTDRRRVLFDAMDAKYDEIITDTFGSALDIGSGSGGVTSILLNKGFRVVASDVNGDALNLIPDTHKRGALYRVVADVLGDNRWYLDNIDIVTMHHVLHLFDDEQLAHAIREVSSCHRFVFDFTNSRSLYSWWIKKRGLHGEPTRSHDFEVVEELLEFYGFKIHRVYGFGVIPQISWGANWHVPLVPRWLTKLSLWTLDILWPKSGTMVMIDARRV